MNELILRELEGVATPAERAELASWRQASPEHERTYQEIRALWALVGTRQEIEPAERIPSAQDLLRPAASPPASRTARRRWLGPAAAAAATILVVFGISRTVDFPQGPDPLTTAEFETGPNELATAVLVDGTVARLGPNTRLRAVIGGDTRAVQLDGRAFFAVTHDPDHPLEVRTAAGGVRVLGTRFELDSRRDRIRLLVVDGAVALLAGGEEVTLGAGEVGEASSIAPVSVSRVEAPERLLDWVGGWVAFEATPLRQVAVELEARLGLQVVIADPAIADRTITGWFSEDERGQIVTMVCRVAEVRCTDVGDTVLIEP